MEPSRAMLIAVVAMAAFVVAMIAQQMLLYRAFLEAKPSVTMKRMIWTHWLSLRRDDFTPVGWRYRQAALACWAIPFIAVIIAAAVLGP